MAESSLTPRGRPTIMTPLASKPVPVDRFRRVDRRAFLRTVAAASAGTGAATFATKPNAAGADPQPAANRISPGRPARYLCFTATLDSLDIPGLIAFCRETGLDGVDLTVRPGFPVTPENVATELPRAVKAFDDAGLAIGQVSGPKDFTDPESAAARAIFQACGKAGIAGVRLGYFTYEKDFDRTLADARRRMAGFARLAAGTGVRAIFHTHSGPCLGNNAASTRLVLQDCDPRHVGVSIDTGHLALNGGPFRMEAEMLRPWITHLAIKDVIWEQNGNLWESRFVPAGQGIVRWTDVRQALEDVAFHGLTTLYAVYVAKDLADRKRLVKHERETLKRLLGS
jgi:sugar phosphate isomerase/epimerase